MGDSVVGRIGDNIYFVWLFGWFQKALFDLKVSPFFVPQLNFPAGWSLAHTEIAPATLLLGYPAFLVGGPTLGYNVAVLLTFILSGFFMYLWIYSLTGDWRAGLIAGTIFTTLPFRIAHFRSGHLNLMGTMWLPLFMWGFFEQLRAKDYSIRWPLLSGIALGLIGLSSIYYLFMTILVALIVGVIYLIFINRGLIRSRVFWKGVLVSVATSLPFILAAGFPFLVLSAEGGLESRSVYSVVNGSASLSDFLLPSTDHFLWGKWVGDQFSRQYWMEGTLYIGLVVSILSVLAWVGWFRGVKRDFLIPLLTLTAVVAFLIALGTHLHWMERIVQVRLPAGLAEAAGREAIGIRLPGFYLYQIVPMFSKIRVFKRFAILGLTCFSAMAGLGAYWILKNIPSRFGNLLAVFLLLLIFIDFYPGPFDTFARVQARPVDYWLAEQPGDGAVIQFPFDQIQDQDQIYNTLIHGKPFVGGFFNAFPPAQYLRIKPILDQFPDDESFDLLRELDVQYVIVNFDFYQSARQDLVQELEEAGLELFVIFGPEYVFTISNAD
jgi:hypothetical protein